MAALLLWTVTKCFYHEKGKGKLVTFDNFLLKERSFLSATDAIRIVRSIYYTHTAVLVDKMYVVATTRSRYVRRRTSSGPSIRPVE